MSVIRVHKNKNFTVMSNVHLRDMDLSLKAKGLLSVMLSLPDNWNYSIAGLCSICKENETAIKSTIKELKEKRYVIVDKKNPNETESKKYEYVYNIFEEPQEENQAIENQGIENLPLDNLPIENHPLNKRTDIPSTNKLNTDTGNTNRLNTDVKYALEDEKQSSKGNIYASVPEEQEGRASQKQNRYIPQEYTDEQLIEHIRQPIRDYMEKEYGGMANEEMSDELINIVVSFHKEYEGQYGKRHKILSDKAYENIVDRYMNPPEEMTDDYSIETYEAMMQRYFEVNYNQRGKYKGNITLGLSHFMSDSVRNNLYCQTCK